MAAANMVSNHRSAVMFGSKLEFGIHSALDNVRIIMDCLMIVMDLDLRQYEI